MMACYEVRKSWTPLFKTSLKLYLDLFVVINKILGFFYFFYLQTMKPPGTSATNAV